MAEDDDTDISVKDAIANLLSQSTDEGGQDPPGKFLKNAKAAAVLKSISDRNLELRENLKIRRRFLRLITILFAASNGAALVMSIAAFGFDLHIFNNTPAGWSGNILFTTEVLMTLIGASVVQTGAIALLAGQFLFKEKKSI